MVPIKALNLSRATSSLSAFCHFQLIGIVAQQRKVSVPSSAHPQHHFETIQKDSIEISVLCYMQVCCLYLKLFLVFTLFLLATFPATSYMCSESAMVGFSVFSTSPCLFLIISILITFDCNTAPYS